MSGRLWRRLAQLRTSTRPLSTYPRLPATRPSLRYGLSIAQSRVACGYNRWTTTYVRDSHSHLLEQEAHNVAATLKACPGCGALAQIVVSGEAGFYSPRRRVVRSFIKSHAIEHERDSGNDEDELVAKALDNVDPELLASLDFQDPTEIGASQDAQSELPLCDRCHDLVHHHTGVSVAHPSMESIQDTIAESPYRYNHIYHVVDAADFQMSLLPDIHQTLFAAQQRSRNRRSKHAGFRHGKKTEISFIITRSDLVAPKKEQVDRMMQYFTLVLRDALGPAGEGVRLGNVRCVSAKRGWWTRELKSDIWERGAGGWMVGKVNVGKSNLFEVVFPKGKAQDINFDLLRNQARLPIRYPTIRQEHDTKSAEVLPETLNLDDENMLLPPARQEAPYPTMPTVSSLPGTTASPIRIPFGNGKGELIDLPGLARSNLETFVLPEYRDDLVMKSRITPSQYVLKPGKSLLIGGILRITPLNPDTVILAYPFVPIKSHMTSTDKAIRLETEGKPEGSGIPFILDNSGTNAMASAGRFQIKWDVTRQRAGPLTSRSAVALKTSQLPFIVLSTDILIEGVGWIELVAQVRKIRGTDEPTHIPEVEVFSPEGRYVGVRRPMNAWMLGGLGTRPSVKHRKQRPRRAMASARKQVE